MLFAIGETGDMSPYPSEVKVTKLKQIKSAGSDNKVLALNELGFKWYVAVRSIDPMIPIKKQMLIASRNSMALIVFALANLMTKNTTTTIKNNTDKIFEINIMSLNSRKNEIHKIISVMATK